MTRPPMSCKEQIGTNRKAVGRWTAGGAGPAGVTLVDGAVVRYLEVCESKGVRGRHGPLYPRVDPQGAAEKCIVRIGPFQGPL
jgi:hypothetical protein